MAKKKNNLDIAEDKIGTLTAIAKRDGGMKTDGKISRSWAKKKMNNPKTRASTKEKINYFLNFNK